MHVCVCVFTQIQFRVALQHCFGILYILLKIFLQQISTHVPAFVFVYVCLYLCLLLDFLNHSRCGGQFSVSDAARLRKYIPTLICLLYLLAHGAWPTVHKCTYVYVYVLIYLCLV